MNRDEDNVKKNRMLWLTCFASAWFIVHCLLVARDGLRDDTQLADVAVVLGNRVEPSGVPGVTLRVRLDRVLALYSSGQVSKIVVSGGKGKEGFEEADVMRDDLRRFGFRDVRGAHGRIRFDLRDAYSLTREFFAFYDYWLLRSVQVSSASSSSPSSSTTDSASST